MDENMNIKNDLNFLNQIFFEFDNSNPNDLVVNSFGGKYNSHLGNKRLFKCPASLPFNLPEYFDPTKTIITNSRHRKRHPRYLATCKSTTAEFFPDYFCSERNGKCFLIDGRDWLSPFEFRVYSGSLEGHWLRAILIQEVYKSDYGAISSRDRHRLVDERNKANWIQEWKETLKQFLTRNDLLQRHRNCPYYECLFNPVNHNIFKSGNIVNSLYVSSRKQSVIIYPSCDFSHLNIISSPDDNRSGVANNGFYSQANCLKSCISSSANDDLFQQIHAIDSCMFDEVSYLTTSSSSSAASDYDDHDSPSVYTSVNYDQERLRTYSVQLAASAKRSPRVRLLYEVDPTSWQHAGESTTDCRRRLIKSHALSRLIPGETVMLVDDELYLATKAGVTTSSTKRSSVVCKAVRIARDLTPKYAASPPWTQSIRFADFAHPRSFLYNDSSQYVSIDCRIRHHADRKDLWTFDQLQRDCLVPNETILQTNALHNEPYMHLILCSQTLMLIDERNTSRPLLAWRHHLSHSNAPVHLTNLLLNESRSHVAVSANSANSGFVYQFSTRVASRPVSFDFTRQLDDFTDLMREINSLDESGNVGRGENNIFYDKSYSRALRNRLIQHPTIGLCHLESRQPDSFALFRLKSSGDLFYETFRLASMQDSGEQNCRQKEKNQIYKNWIDIFQKRFEEDTSRRDGTDALHSMPSSSTVLVESKQLSSSTSSEKLPRSLMTQRCEKCLGLAHIDNDTTDQSRRKSKHRKQTTSEELSTEKTTKTSMATTKNCQTQDAEKSTRDELERKRNGVDESIKSNLELIQGLCDLETAASTSIVVNTPMDAARFQTITQRVYSIFSSQTN